MKPKPIWKNEVYNISISNNRIDRNFKKANENTMVLQIMLSND